MAEAVYRVEGVPLGKQVFTARALLIDNDGVLVDSLASIRLAFSRWGEMHGLDGDAIYRGFGGQRSEDIARILFGPQLGASAALELDQLEIELAPLVRALPGAHDLLAPIGGDWTLVTSGPRALATARLAASGLPIPRILVSGDDVTAGKPSPQSYLLAAQLNNVEPQSCLVLEDSLVGVGAAVAAGCRTVRIGDEDLLGQVFRVPALTHVSVTGSTGRYSITVWADE